MSDNPLASVSDKLEDIDDVPGVGEQNVLSQLREALEAKIAIPVIEMPVIKRPGVSVLFKPEVSSSQLRSWQKRCTNKRGELDNVRFSSMVIVSMSQGLKVNDTEVLTESGDSFELNSKDFAEFIGVDMGEIIPEGIRLLYGIDAHVEATALRLLDEAGYGDSPEIEDPTKGS